MTIAPEQPPHDRRQIRVIAERAVAMHVVCDLEVRRRVSLADWDWGWPA